VVPLTLKKEICALALKKKGGLDESDNDLDIFEVPRDTMG